MDWHQGKNETKGPVYEYSNEVCFNQIGDLKNHAFVRKQAEIHVFQECKGCCRL